ncbi:MAG: hypothetical protein NZ765_11255 [Anaerolineae bacterium]|nr:hypothetical protein [Anaerolineae bacterium]MDW8072187.1 hypothetical protein [Anaerolineae bacterium]
MELLLARYGEAMPTFEGVSAERASSIAPTKPLAAQRVTSEVPLPARVEPEDAGLLDELEQLKQTLKQEQPVSVERQSSEEPGMAAAPSTAYQGVGDWLAELRALQAKATSDATPVAPSEEHPLEAAPQTAHEVSQKRESPPPLESVAEPAFTPQPDTLPAEAPLPSLEERLGALTPPEDRAESVPEESVPEWLRELDLVQAKQPSGPPSGEPDQLSDALGPLPVAEAGQPGEGGESLSDEEIPDWLKRLIAISSQASESPLSGEEAEPTQPLGRGDTAAEATPAVEATSEEALPDWLRELEAMQTARLSTPTLPEERGTLPPQLAEAPTEAQETTISPPPGAEEKVAAAIQPEEVSPVVAEKPPAEWLAELEELIEHPPVSQPSPWAAEEEEVPDWLRELTAEKPTPPPEAQAPIAPAIVQPEPAALPEWTSRLQPTEPTVETPSAEPTAPSPQASVAPSGQDVIETLRARLGVPQVPDIEGAEMFREIISEPAETPLTPVPEDVEPTPRRSIVSIILWALVFAAILLGIATLSLALLARIQELLGETAFQRFLNTPAAAGLVASLEQFRRPITKLYQGEVVLLSLDYTPATAAEMQPLAAVVLRDLLVHKARVLTVSLQPEGAPLAQRLLDEVASTYPYGEYTLNLGYLPGEAIGVRSLAHLPTRQVYVSPDDTCRSLDTCPGWHDIRGIEDVALFITIADSAEPVRWWVEQLPMISSSELPMLAAMSAAALPAVRPYLIAVPAVPSRLTGLIGGMMATAAYEVYTGRPGQALSMVAAQSAAHLGLVIVALAGIFAGIRTRTGPR